MASQRKSDLMASATAIFVQLTQMTNSEGAGNIPEAIRLALALGRELDLELGDDGEISATGGDGPQGAD